MCVWTSSKSWKCLLFTHFISLQVTFHFPVSFCSSSMFFYHLCSTQFYPNREVSFFKQKEKQKHKTLYQPAIYWLLVFIPHSCVNDQWKNASNVTSMKSTYKLASLQFKSRGIAHLSSGKWLIFPLGLAQDS